MKLAIIGTGSQCQQHLRAWLTFREVTVVGIITQDSTLQQEAEENGITIYNRLESLIQYTDVDVIDIATPVRSSLELVTMAAEANIHVIYGTLAAINSNEVSKMISVCMKHKVQLLMGNTYRHTPEFIQARHQINKGLIGKTGVIRIRSGIPYPNNDDQINIDRNLFKEVGLPHFDWLRWTFGEVEMVMSRRVIHSDIKGTPIEYGFVTLRMTDGTIAYLECSWSDYAQHTSFELTGNKGMITYDSQDNNPLLLQNHLSTLIEYKKEGVDTRIFRHYLQCLLGNEKPAMSAEDVMKALQLADAANQSVAQGQPVFLSKGVECL